ncbi:velvet factor [Ceratobasidium sp. AG-Ba]|nr:velvet factor [Ceratobasidium sp. AG-Ba]QRW02053.1 velvet factor [Ceratobasidium sp. AG-Ba]
MQPSVSGTRARPKKTFKGHDSMNPQGGQMETWGKWQGNLRYSLEVVQHPLRARIPLAPAAVAKMVVQRQDDSIVDADEIDIAFFLVTVDLWSDSGTEEMNLVLHPSSGGHATSSYSSRRIKRPPTTSYNIPPPATAYDSQQPSTSAAPTAYPPRQENVYPPRGPDDGSGYSQRPDAGYPPPRPEGAPYPGRAEDPHTQTQYPSGYDEPQRGNWPPPYPPSAAAGNAPPPPGAGPAPAEHAPYQTLPSIGTLMSSPSPHPQHAPPPHSHQHQRSYPAPGPPPPQWGYGSQNAGYIDPGLQQPHHPHSHPHHPPPVPTTGPAYPEEGGGYPPSGNYYVQTPAALHGAGVGPHDVGASTAGGQYTRTLVGPLSANASRLVDADDQPGIFFLFQDLSVRTEGTFRLRMRLMNVGAHPAPNAHATHVTTTSAPVLAQTFTDPFTVYSAKRFPGVPETTPLSVAFGTQGQKLPLRNRNPGASSKKRGRKGRGGSDSDGDSEGGDSEDSQGSNN